MFASMFASMFAARIDDSRIRPASHGFGN